MVHHIVAGFTALLSLSHLALAQRLDKPALRNNLDDLQQGLLDHLPSMHYTADKWGPGWIPQDCKTMTRNAGFDPADVETFNVHYDDVSVGRHSICTQPIRKLTLV